MNVVAVPTEHQWADLFTKSLPAPRFRFLVDSICGKNPAPLTRGPGTKLKDDCVSAITNAARTIEKVVKNPASAKTANEFFADHFEEPKMPSQTAAAA